MPGAWREGASARPSFIPCGGVGRVGPERAGECPLVNVRTDVNKMAATVFGALFILVGILGFVKRPILGVFASSLQHDLVHLLSGAALLAAAFAAGGRHARTALFAMGGVYALVTILGFIQRNRIERTTGIVINEADNFLHLFLAAVLLLVPLLFKEDAPAARKAGA